MSESKTETKLVLSLGLNIYQAAEALLEAGPGHFFDFNEARVRWQEGDTVETVVARYHETLDANHQAYLASPEYAEAEERRRKEAEERPIKLRAAIDAMRSMDEKELRDVEAPWPHTEDEFLYLIETLSSRSHDYGTCVYAMSIAAVSAFNLMAHKLGASGFQASCADLDVVRRTRGLRSGFAIVDFSKALYPQYKGKEHWYPLSRILSEHREALANEARRMLSESAGAHENVRAHWEWLSSRHPGASEGES